MFLQPHKNNHRVRKLNMFSDEGINKSWILLDSQSTIDVFSNADLLTDSIHETSSTL